MNCSKCGSDNKVDAQFCKKCGADLTDKNVINKLNKHVNLLAVFLGLIISIIVLFIGAILFSEIVKSNVLPLTAYLLLVFLIMAFLGSILTGLLGSKSVYEGYINGGFLSLVILVLTGFILGILLFAAMGISALLSSAFGSGASTSAISSLNSTTSSSGTGSLDGLIYIAEFIISIILIFIAGIVGGGLGFYIKTGIKQIMK